RDEHVLDDETATEGTVRGDRSLVLSCRQYRQDAHLLRPSPLHPRLPAGRRDDGSTGHLRRLYRLVGHAPHSTTLLRRLDPGDDGDFYDHSVSVRGRERNTRAHP